MKISYRTHPILEKLNNGKLGKLDFYKENQLWVFTNSGELNKIFAKYLNKFNSNIDFITTPFAEALSKNITKLIGIFDYLPRNNESDILAKDMFNAIGIEELSGTIIYDNTTILYHITKTDVVVFQFYHDKKTDLFVLELYADNFTEIDCLFQPAFKDEVINEKTVREITGCAVNTLLFKKFAEVETKYLPPNKKTKDINCKYVNDTKIGVTILDSKWFTTLVKSDEFTVHGHFRLQPCGKEMKDRKLIWINDFVKSGYTAPARKLTTT